MPIFTIELILLSGFMLLTLSRLNSCIRGSCFVSKVLLGWHNLGSIFRSCTTLLPHFSSII